MLTIRDSNEFMSSFEALAEDINKNAVNHGFWGEEVNQAEKICLMHSELSEALEATRKGNPADEHCPAYTSLEVELADTVIRIMDFAHGMKLDVAGAILAKHGFNKTRPMKHGKKF